MNVSKALGTLAFSRHSILETDILCMESYKVTAVISILLMRKLALRELKQFMWKQHGKSYFKIK